MIRRIHYTVQTCTSPPRGTTLKYGTIESAHCSRACPQGQPRINWYGVLRHDGTIQLRALVRDLCRRHFCGVQVRFVADIGAEVEVTVNRPSWLERSSTRGVSLDRYCSLEFRVISWRLKVSKVGGCQAWISSAPLDMNHRIGRFDSHSGIAPATGNRVA